MLYLSLMMKRMLLVRNIRQKLKTEFGFHESGFSLLELLVVLLCLSVIVGVAIPGYLRISENQALQAAAEKLFTDLKECQAQALLQHTPGFITFAGDSGYEVRGVSHVIKQIVLKNGIRIVDMKIPGSNDTLGFNEQGHPQSGGSIVLGNHFGKRMKLTLHLHSGQVQLTEDRNE